MIMKTSLLILLTLICSVYGISATVTYEVNDNSRGVSIPNTFDWAINQAVASANSGDDVIIELNFQGSGGQGGLFLDSKLPTIDNTNGSILIRKKTGAYSPFLTLHPSNFNWTGNNAVGLRISGINVTVKDIKFQNFENLSGSPLTSAVAIDILHSEGVKIEGNIFKVVSPAGNGTGYGIRSNGTATDVSIAGNEFEGAIYGIDLSAAVGTTTINSNNTFTNVTNPIVVSSSGSTPVCDITNNSIDGTSQGGITFNFSGGAQASIKNNSINEGGITIINPIFNLANELLIEDNEVSNFILGVNITGPQHNWSIINNKFNPLVGSSGATAFHIDNNISFPTDDFYINFIDDVDNFFGFPIQNHGNEINNCAVAFEFEEMKNCHILNYDVDGGARVHSTYPVTIMETLLKVQTVGTDHIFLYIGGNQNFGPHSITSSNPAALEADNSGYNLSLDYSLNFTQWQNTGNYVVEFFKMSADGTEMIDFLGREIVTYTDLNPVTFSGNFTKDFYFSSAPDIEGIGLTVTSLGNLNDPVNYPTTASTKVGTSNIKFVSVSNASCNSCELFEPITEGKYWVSAWVSVDYPFQMKTFDNRSTSGTTPSLSVDFVDVNGVSSNQAVQFFPTDDIIDGWQRIVGAFEIPQQTSNIDLVLEADATYPTYFDDIRIHPFNASMKSYVYDGETFWLTSELDDNNYATFYEYDNEGGLIRIKKETSRGIVTIQETGSSQIKKENP